MAIISAISRLGRQIAVERKTGGAYNADGDWVPSAVTTTFVQASLQPASSTLLANKPEGIQSETRKIVWTAEPLRENDVIVDGAHRYRILDIEDWQADGGYSVGYLGSLGSAP